MIRKEINRNPFAMELNELRTEFKKWEEILIENVLCLIGNRDHINACEFYMLYCLSTHQPFNLAYYVAKRMAAIPTLGTTALLCGILLTRIF